MKKKIVLSATMGIIITGIVISALIYIKKNTSSPKDMILIPKGEFSIGSDDTPKDSQGIEGASKASVFTNNETPLTKIYLVGFFMDKFEVTNEDYKQFVEKQKYSEPIDWMNGTYEKGRDKHPVTNVSWVDAKAYCTWVGKRLPSEEEWEKAARGPDGNIYPWGNEFNLGNANFNKGDSSPKGSINTDRSYYGVFDLAGNVLEWTSSWYKAYPGSKYVSDDYGEVHKVLRGATGLSRAHYNLPGVFTRASNRLFFPPEKKAKSLGFRCAKNFSEKH